MTNDPLHPRIYIALKATVTPIFESDAPEGLRIETRLGAPAGVSTIITSNLAEPVKVTRVSHNFGDKAEVRLEPIDPGRKYKLTLRTEAKKKIKWGGSVTLDLEGAPVKKFSLSAFIEVQD